MFGLRDQASRPFHPQYQRDALVGVPLGIAQGEFLLLHFTGQQWRKQNTVVGRGWLFTRITVIR